MSFNPFLKLNYYLSGGRRRLIGSALLYLALVVAGWQLIYRVQLAEQGPRGAMMSPEIAQLVAAQTSSTMLGLVAGSQALFLFLLAPFAVAKAVNLDRTSGMLESHRLTPLSGVRIAFGYLTGAPVQYILMYVASLIVGVYLSQSVAAYLGVTAATMVRSWLGGQVLVISLSLLAATFLLLFALHAQVKSALPLVMVLFFGGGTLMHLAPGVGLLVGWYAAQLLFSVLQGNSAPAGDFGPMMVWSLITQIAVATICFFSAARKIRTPDQSVFSIFWSLALVSAICIATIGGMALDIGWSKFEQDAGEGFKVQLTASYAVLLVLAFFVHGAVADALVRNQRAAAFGTPVSFALRNLYWLIPLLLMLMICATPLLPLLGADEVTGGPAQAVAMFTKLAGDGALPIALLALFVFDVCVLAGFTLRGAKGRVMLTGIFLLLRIVPHIIDIARLIILDADDPFYDPTIDDFAWAGRISPFGTLLLSVWGGRGLWPGVAVQAALAVGAILFWRRARSVYARRAAATSAPAYSR